MKARAILELARQEITRRHPTKAREKLIDVLSDHKLAKIQMSLAGLLPGGKMPSLVSKLLSGQEPEAETPQVSPNHPWPDLDPSSLPQIRGEVYLLEGCVMRVLYPDTHESTRRLLRRVGYRVREVKAGCCGALHAHAGYLESAEKLAERLALSFSDDLPIIVNSAGCGSTMKHYGQIFAPDAEGLAKRTFDASEFLLTHGLGEELRKTPGLPSLIGTYHDACHLAHGQKIRQEPRELLRQIPGMTWVELPESAMCCGSAGTYNVFQPAKARELLERKWKNIASTGATVLASGNPGCHAWIAQAAREKEACVRVIHTIDLLESSFSGLRPA
ncbi:MAG: (Fe-S)-binding protein [Fimbriimonadaceae bacterium]|nr:(Fe-S)-binding protein [Fimbriimonadaceae bacterium]